MAVAIAVAFAVDRLVIARAGHVAAKVGEGPLSRAAETRLRLVRRLLFVVILVIGAALALSRFAQFERLATGILASSAVLGLVVGFAARQTLANLVAGILIAITQPIRIGDTVTIGEDSGRVDDLTLSYTYIDPGDGRLMVVPNEKVVTSVLFNHSTGDRTAPATVSVWVPPAADLERAREVLKPAGAAEVMVAEMTPQGVRIELKGPRDHERTQVGDEEAELREKRPRGAARGGPARSAVRRVADPTQLPFSSQANDSASAQEVPSLAGLGSPEAPGGVRRPGRPDRHPRGRGRHLGAERPSRHAPARPAEAGQGGGQLGRVRCRRRPPGLHPVGHDPAPGVGRQDPPGARPRHGGDRGRALLRARRDRLRGDRARRLGGPEGGRGGPGRLDDHPAARPQPLHRRSRGDDRAEDPRGDLGGGVRARSTRRRRSSPST